MENHFESLCFDGTDSIYFWTVVFSRCCQVQDKNVPVPQVRPDLCGNCFWPGCGGIDFQPFSIPAGPARVFDFWKPGGHSQNYDFCYGWIILLLFT